MNHFYCINLILFPNLSLLIAISMLDKDLTQFLSTKRIEIVDLLKKRSFGFTLQVKLYGDEKNLKVVKIFDNRKMANPGLVFIRRYLPTKQLFTSSVLGKCDDVVIDDQFCLILEPYYEQKCLATHLQVIQCLSEKKCKQIFSRVMDGLEHMHKLSVAHRNLKLENIILNDQKEPILIGFAYLIGYENNPDFNNMPLTSLCYYAPEMIEQFPYNPFVSDMWNLGVCLFISLNNRLPFNSNAFYKEQQPRLNYDRKVEAILSCEMKCTLSDLLTKNVNKRANFREVREHWTKEKN